MIRTICACAAGALLALGASLPAKATVVDNTSLAAPPGVYFGSGNANSNFTVDNEGGIELGLSAITRFVGPIVPTPTTSNIYDVPLGTAPAPHTGAAWGFDFSINLQPPGGSSLTLGDITALLTLTDVVNGTTGSFNPLLIPDNSQFGPSGVVHCPNVLCTPANTAAQNSEALSFASIAGAFGDPGFDLNANDTYILTLGVSSPTGARLASDTIVINAGRGAPVPVPEPASILLIGTALLGFAGMRYRRRPDLKA